MTPDLYGYTPRQFYTLANGLQHSSRRRPIANGLILPQSGPVHRLSLWRTTAAEESPAYRAAMRDAGRGRLLP